VKALNLAEPQSGQPEPFGELTFEAEPRSGGLRLSPYLPASAFGAMGESIGGGRRNSCRMDLPLDAQGRRFGAYQFISDINALIVGRRFAD
jgi:hypothetical protein